MGIEDGRPANDNFSQGELREQRKNALLEYGTLVNRVQAWIANRQEEIAPIKSPNMRRARRDEIRGGIAVLRTMANVASSSIDIAEDNMNSLESFKYAKQSADALHAAFVEAEQTL